MKFAGNEKGILRWPNATINLFLTKPLLYYSSVLLLFSYVTNILAKVRLDLEE